MLPPPVVLEPDLVKRFARVDREAFLAVYEAYAPALRALVARFFPRPFEREEAVQEVWLMIHRNAVSFDPSRGDLLPWLRTVAANRCKELLRAQGRRPRAEAEIDEDGLSESADPEATVGARRLCLAVARFAEGLSSEEAAVFRLSLLEERGHDDVASALRISARRCKYLRMKLLARMAAHPELRAALREVLDP